MKPVHATRLLASPVAALSLATSALAGDSTPVPAPASDAMITENSSESVLDALWDLPVLYSNKENPILQEFSVLGRYQGQYAVVDSDQGDFDDWENRRWRVGAGAKLFDRVSVKGYINVDEDFNPFYKSLEELHMAIKVVDALSLTVGKHKPYWGYEWTTSSSKIITIERGLLTNQLLPAKSSGVSADGEVNGFSYNVGVYSADLDDEFGGFDGGTFYTASIGYDFSESSSMDKLAWRLDYLYNNSEPDDTAAKPYDNSWATSLVLGQGDLTIVNEVLYASGDSPDAFGISIMPSYDITEKIQVVGRYQYAHGDDDGIRAQSRYERKVPSITDSGYGEDYHAFYLGLNYYIHGHGLKLMSGLEYATLDGGSDGGDYDGLSWVTGIRLNF
ncbi:MAG: phosphate-selective porin OprO/OprP [Verrucomicrobiales bacterium]|jgi:phosphate-selective porin OprO/OprP